MRQTEKETPKSPACGYGLLGLCCSACLLGPCRLNPFDEDSGKGLCGDDRDRMVAKNLLRLTIHESAQDIKHLRDAILEASSRGLASPVIEASKDLLSLFPVRINPLLSSPYAEKVFPSIHRIFRGEGFPPKSLTGVLLDSVDIAQNGSSGVEEILNRCLQISLLRLMTKEHQHDVNQLIHGEQLPDENQKTSDVLEHLPSTPCPLLIQVSDDDAPSPIADELEKRLDEEGSILSLRGKYAFPDIGRKLFRKWDLSAMDLRAVVLISSKWVTSTLGVLALGFTVASFPPLPIQGSGRVENFFLKDFRKRFGNAYLPSWQENLDSIIMECLKGKG